MLAHGKIAAPPADHYLREERARQVLSSFGIDIFTDARLSQLRGALHHPQSVWFAHSESDKFIIENAIFDLVGEPKQDKSKKTKRERKPAADLDFSRIDCDLQLLAILVSRFPYRPYCCDEFVSNAPRRLDCALTKRYIQFNPPNFKSMIVVDVDRMVSDRECLDAGLPPPTWIAKNPKNGHAHYSWLLKSPVWAGSSNQKPAKYFEAIQEGYRAALAGDDGFSGLLTKNPASKSWDISSTCDYAQYDLSHLAEFVDLTKSKPKKKKEIKEGPGRNCMLFDAVREWSYPVVGRFADQISFGAAVQDHAERLTLHWLSQWIALRFCT